MFIFSSLADISSPRSYSK